MEVEAEHWGRLSLVLSSSSLDTGGDLSLELKLKTNVLEDALASHYGFSSVQVSAIVESGRRLEATGSVVVVFAGRGGAADLSRPGVLLALQEAFVAANSGVAIKEANIQWTDGPAAQEEDQNAASRGFLGHMGGLIMGLLAAASLFCATVITGYVWCKSEWRKQLKKKRRVNVEANTSDVAELGKPCDPESGGSHEKDSAKEALDDTISIGSTRSPDSDQMVCEDVLSNEGDANTCTIVSV